MVDKENQWDEDIEYSQNNVQDQDYGDAGYDDNEEYSEQDYDDYEEDDDRNYSSGKKGSNQIVILVIALLLLGVAGFLFASKMGANRDGGNEGASQLAAEQNIMAESDSNINSSQDNMGDMFFEQAGGNPDDMVSVNFNDTGEAQVKGDDNNDVVATVSDSQGSTMQTEDDLFGKGDLTTDPSKENNDIIVSYDKASRENPFKPPVYAKQTDNNVVINNTEFEIIEPPTTSVPDENLTRLLQTQISGILYDEVSPSAIVNLNGMDSFVKVGDTISGYTIQAITKDKVQINYKSNSYVASVGELFVRGSLEKQRAVANLEKKFAGRYKDN